MDKYKMHHPTTKLLSYRQYWTFQGFYRVVSSDKSMTPEDVFAKCILRVAQWIKDRVDFESESSEVDFLAFYPKAENYKAFSEMLFGDEETVYQRAKRYYDISIFAAKSEQTWTVRIIEPDNAKESSDYPGRVFITNLAIKLQGENVYVAARTTCKEPSNNTSEAGAFRPACLYYIYEDEDFIMYEGGIESDSYPINGMALQIKTTSEQDCRSLYDDLISYKKRQMPIILCPSLEDGDFKAKVEKLGHNLASFAYVFYEEKPKHYSKLFLNVLNSDYVRAKTIQSYFWVILPDNSEDAEKWKSFTTDINGIRDLKKYVTSYTVRRDGETKKPKFEYGDVLFNGALWEKYVKDVEDSADPGLFEDMRSQLEILAQQSDSLPENEREDYDVRINSLSKHINELEEKNVSLSTQNKNYQGIISEKNSEISRLKNSLDEVQRNAPAIIIDNSKSEENIINIDTKGTEAEKQWNDDFPNKYTEIISWIKEKFNDTILIHPDAEKAFNKLATHDLNVKRFGEAISLLDCYVRFNNAKLDPSFFGAVESRTSFRVTPHGFTGAKKDYPAYYINIKESGYEENSVLCNWHIKFSSQSKESFRIYFAYIKELQKAVIGSMPDHLSTGEFDDRNRKNKV